MNINVIYKQSTAAYMPKLTDGGAYREPGGTLRLYYYPYFEEAA